MLKVRAISDQSNTMSNSQVRDRSFPCVLLPFTAITSNLPHTARMKWEDSSLELYAIS